MRPTSSVPSGPGVANNGGTAPTPRTRTMPRKPSRSKNPEPTVQGVLGLGLDAADGQKRVTRTEEMVLVGGSHETHERMQEAAIRFSEALEKKGKKLQETTVREAMEMLREAHERAR